MNPQPSDDEYRPFPASPGYLVSRDGRVFTCRHTGGVWRELKTQSRKRMFRGPAVVLFTGPRGQARREVWPVAKMVALTFLGPKPPGMWLVVRPVGSLRAEHMKYMTTEERRAARPPQKGEQAPNRKLTAIQVVAIRRAVAAAVGEGRVPDWAGLSEQFRVCEVNIKTIAAGRSWKSIDAGVPLWVPPPPFRFTPGHRLGCHLTPEQARDIRRRKANRESLGAVVASYRARGIGKGPVEWVWYGQTYKEIKP